MNPNLVTICNTNRVLLSSPCRSNPSLHHCFTVFNNIDYIIKLILHCNVIEDMEKWLKLIFGHLHFFFFLVLNMILQQTCPSGSISEFLYCAAYLEKWLPIGKCPIFSESDKNFPQNRQFPNLLSEMV